MRCDIYEKQDFTRYKILRDTIFYEIRYSIYEIYEIRYIRDTIFYEIQYFTRYNILLDTRYEIVVVVVIVTIKCL